LPKNGTRISGFPVGTPSNYVRQSFALDETPDIVIHLWTNRQQRKQVAYVEFRGKATKLYEYLLARKQETDDQIEGDILWDSPGRGCFSIEEAEVAFNDRSDWPIQHSWFCEELEDIVQTLRKALIEFNSTIQA